MNCKVNSNLLKKTFTLILRSKSSVQNNLFLEVVLGKFNSKSSNWCKNDKTTIEGKKNISYFQKNISSEFGF